MTATRKVAGRVRLPGSRWDRGMKLAQTVLSGDGSPVFSFSEEEKELLMTGSATVSAPTLWDLAMVVFEEVEKVCGDERRAMSLAREILIHIIQRHVTNMEVEPSFSHVLAREGAGRSGQGPGRGAFDR